MYHIQVFKNIKNSIKKKLYAGIEAITFDATTLYFKNYPFEPSFCYQNQTIEATQIKEIYLTTFPPTLKIGKELIFIPKNQEVELKIFAESNNVKIAQRNTNWDWINDPFLDTEFTKEQQENTLELLEQQGFTRQEINDVRKTIEQPMLRYNSLLWEWQNLGLYDVLLAMNAKTRKRAFKDFYWKAMEIELRTKS